MVIQRGGQNEERLYLYSLTFPFKHDIVHVDHTDMPGIDNIVARHKARYYLPAFFCRPGMRVLDIPCGSGYGFEILRSTGVQYHGMDNDPVTIEYCKRIYNENGAKFMVGDLTDSVFGTDYDIIMCIEGIEHIEAKYQAPLVRGFFNALKPGGMLVISSPYSIDNQNPYHRHEMNSVEFTRLLYDIFGDVQCLSFDETLHSGSISNCMYGVCKK